MKKYFLKLKRFLIGDERKVIRRHRIPEIGEFSFKGSSERWSCKVDGVNFEIEGDWSSEMEKIKPSDKAIGAALEFYRNKSSNFRELDEFLKMSKCDHAPPGVNDVSSIVFDDDGTAEIQFSEKLPVYWYCQYVGKKFCNLSFDR